MDPMQNVLPGDTKFTGNEFDITGDILDIMGNSSMKPLRDRDRWAKVTHKCIERVNHHAKCYGTRYCYTVSPIEALAARRTMEEATFPSGSLARTRPTRDLFLRWDPLTTISMVSSLLFP